MPPREDDDSPLKAHAPLRRGGVYFVEVGSSERGKTLPDPESLGAIVVVRDAADADARWGKQWRLWLWRLRLRGKQVVFERSAGRSLQRGARRLRHTTIGIDSVCDGCGRDIPEATPMAPAAGEWLWLGCEHCGARIQRDDPRIAVPRWPARLLIGLSAVALLTVLGCGWAYFTQNDEALGRKLSRLISGEISGKIQIGRIHWGVRALADLALGTATPLEIGDVSIHDSAGRVVIAAKQVFAEFRPWALLAHGELRFARVELRDGIVAVEEMRDRSKPVGIADAFMPRRRSPKRKVSKGGGGAPLLVFEDIQIHDVDFRLRVAETRIDIPRVRVRARMQLEGDPTVSGISLVARHVSAGHGLLRQGAFRLVAQNLRCSDVRIEGQRLSAKELLGEVAGSPVVVDGGLDLLFRGDPTIDVRANAQNVRGFLGQLLGVAIPSRPGLKARVFGPVVAPRVEASLVDGALAAGPAQLQGIALKASIDTGKGILALEEGSAKLWGGTVKASGRMGLADGSWKAAIALSALNPQPLAQELRGQLGGTLKLSGRLDRQWSVLAVSNLQLKRERLGHGAARWIPRRIALRGSAHITPRIVDLASLTLDGDGNQIVFRGSVHPQRQRANVFASLHMPNLGSWLAGRLGAKLFSGAQGQLHIAGAFPRLAATGAVQAFGVGYAGQELKRVHANVSYSSGRLLVRDIRSEGFGGKVSGQGSFDLFAGDLLHPKRSPAMRAQLHARGIALKQLFGGELVGGKADLNVTVQGPISGPRGTATLSSAALRIGKGTFRTAHARLGLLADRLSVYETVLERHGGGRLRVWGDIFFDGRLQMGIRSGRFPLAAVPGVADLNIGLGGFVSGELAVMGKANDPRLSGKIELEDAQVRGVHVGNGWLRLTPGSDNMRIDGLLLGGALRLNGFALMQPHRSLHLSLGIDRFPVHQIVPELQKAGDIRGFLSGKVALDLDEEKGLTWVNTRLTRAEFSMRYRPSGRRTYRTLKLDNQDDVLVTFDGTALRVVTARMVSAVSGKEGTRAEFSVGGSVGRSTLDLGVRGMVPLQLAEFFFARQIRGVGGKATADLRLRGTIEDPRLTGQLELRGGTLRLPRFDRAVEIPQARIVAKQNRLVVEKLAVRVGRASLAIAGQLEGVGGLLFGASETPSLNLKIDGDLNMRLLRILAPSAVSQASGLARTSVVVSGLLDDPMIAGNLIIDKGQRIEFRPRGIGRSVTLTGGHLRLDRSYVGTVTPLVGTYDEGSVELAGEARFNEGELVDIYLKLKGRSIPHRQPKVFSAEVDMDLTLVGDPKATSGPLRCGLSKRAASLGQSMMLQGRVDIVDARYMREFDLLKDAVIRPRTSEDERPFWEGVPALGALGLCLTVRSAGQLRVKNRYADLGLETTLAVTGTLADTRIQGSVLVEEGKVKIPATRPTFTVNRGEIAFSEGRPMDTPELDISAETVYPDRHGTDYKIRLRLTGSLSQIQFQLSSEPFLERGQLLALLAWGRTTEQLRQDINRGNEGNQTAGAADAQVKELSAMFLSSILEDPIRQVTGLDLVRLELGTETLTARACKSLGSFEICGDLEKNLSGGYSSKGSVRYRLHDYLRLVGRIEQLSTKLERERENPNRARLELKWAFPLR